MMDTVAASRVLRLNEADDVGIALEDIARGAPISTGLTARDAIPRGHKLALNDVKSGAQILKLGAPIGLATRTIRAGEHVHTHNLGFAHLSSDRRALTRVVEPSSVIEAATFDGYRRADGRVGTRNYLAVMATVNCSATVVRAIAERFARTHAPEKNFDGVIALTHDHGCSVRADGPGLATLRRTLAGYASHPNVAATLVIGLGCEDNHIENFLAQSGLTRSERLKTLAIQSEGGTTATIEAGCLALEDLMPLALAAQRSQNSASALTVGLQCGGSDGFSTLTANPALGRAVDRLIDCGGTAILAETPEIYGAESLLLSRVTRKEIAERLIALIEWWERESKRDGGTLDNNPAPGNKDGGITTILEKSLGAVAKAGSRPLAGVYDYAERVIAHGLTFMDSPGYDPVSATGQVAAGANIVCFTTGRGSCFGAKGAPSLKHATNSDVFRRMEGDMDLSCGEIADGTATIDEIGARIFDVILATASGQRTKSELLGYGAEEFIPWTPGLTY
jgi:altronate hydrolase